MVAQGRGDVDDILPDRLCVHIQNVFFSKMSVWFFKLPVQNVTWAPTPAAAHVDFVGTGSNESIIVSWGGSALSAAGADSLDCAGCLKVRLSAFVLASLSD